MTNATWPRGGSTTIESERLSSALLALVNEALRTGTYGGERMPEQVLRGWCSECNEYGLRVGSYEIEACRHRMGVLAYVVQQEGLPVTVRKPVTQEAA